MAVLSILFFNTSNSIFSKIYNITNMENYIKQRSEELEKKMLNWEFGENIKPNIIDTFHTQSILGALEMVEKWAEGKKPFFQSATGGTMDSSLYAKGVLACLSDLINFIKSNK